MNYYDTFKNPKRRSFFIGFVVAIWIFSVLGIIIYFQIRSIEVPASVENAVSSGYRILVLRLPISENIPQQEIVIFDDNALSNYPRYAIRGPVPLGRVSIDDYSKYQMPHTQWASINNLRNMWCSESLTDSTDGTIGEFYELGINCGVWDQRRVFLLIEDLPMEFKLLINITEGL